MKKFALITILSVLFTAALFAAYPTEYPLYLRMLGFSKDEIKALAEGRFITHSLPNKAEGEYGIVAARVVNVPIYYFRDYYSHIENYKSVMNFHQISLFGKAPKLQDLKPLRFEYIELQEFLDCKVKDCGLELSPEEIKNIPVDIQLTDDASKAEVSDAYRNMLLQRLLTYQKEGTRRLSAYQDGESEESPEAILQAHLLKFEHIDAYFPVARNYLLNYPRVTSKNTTNFFYWSKEYYGNKPMISLRHVFTQRAGEDYLIVNKLIYSTHYMLSSLGVVHLIQYVDRNMPATLIVYQQRTLTDLSGNPFESIGRNILRSNLEKKTVDGLKLISKEMVERYHDRAFTKFPYLLQPKDQR